jgi:hypothetical protein
MSGRQKNWSQCFQLLKRFSSVLLKKSSHNSGYLPLVTNEFDALTLLFTISEGNKVTGTNFLSLCYGRNVTGTICLYLCNDNKVFFLSVILTK